MKSIAEVLHTHGRHWVGDGFPVRTLFSYGPNSDAVSPFLLLDYGGPHVFPPAARPRGVGAHPHRGFETVTIVYEGEVAHRDSAGNSGVIGPGDVQWMTAGTGIVHEEFHSPRFTQSGGPFRMVQLWVNLPARSKMTAPGYQAILDADIPTVELAEGAGRVRVIAGAFRAANGPARTFTPVNLWDVRLRQATDLAMELPEGHTALIAVLSGRVIVNDVQPAGEAEVIRLERQGKNVRIGTESDAILLVLTGEPIDEPIVGHGSFVMNTRAEIRQAMEDYNAGRMGQIVV